MPLWFSVQPKCTVSYRFKYLLFLPLSPLGAVEFFKFFGSFPGPREEVVRLLNDGQLVSIAPGGTREAMFSQDYNVMWGGRVGFAKAAMEANVVS